MPLSEVQNVVAAAGEGTLLDALGTKQAKKTSARQAPASKTGAGAFRMTAPKLKAPKTPAPQLADETTEALATKPSLGRAPAKASDNCTSQAPPADPARAPKPARRGRPAKASASAVSRRQAKPPGHQISPVKPAAADPQAEKAKPSQAHPCPPSSNRPTRETQAQKSARLARGEPASSTRGYAAPSSPPAAGRVAATSQSVPGSNAKPGRRRRAQPKMYGDWVNAQDIQDTPVPGHAAICAEDEETGNGRKEQQNETASTANEAPDPSSPQDGGWKVRVQEAREVGAIAEEMARLAEALPEEEQQGAGRKGGRRSRPKEAPLRQRLVESWEGKSYYERLVAVAADSVSPDDCSPGGDASDEEEQAVENVTDALLRMDLKPADRRRSVAVALSAAQEEANKPEETSVPAAAKKGPAAGPAAPLERRTATVSKAALKQRAARNGRKAKAPMQTPAGAASVEEELPRVVEEPAGEIAEPSIPAVSSTASGLAEQYAGSAWVSPEIGIHESGGPAATLLKQLEDLRHEKAALLEENDRLQQALVKKDRELEEARAGILQLGGSLAAVRSAVDVLEHLGLMSE